MEDFFLQHHNITVDKQPAFWKIVFVLGLNKI